MKHLDYLILESKQVGIIYHFTGIWNLYEMIKFDDFELKTLKSYISFTRNPTMFSPELRLSKMQCRIMIDGDKLSNKYAISPFIDKVSGILRNHGENEERIIKYSMWNKKRVIDVVDIKDSILEICVLDEPVFREYKDTKNSANNFEFEPNMYMDANKDMEKIIQKHKEYLDMLEKIYNNKKYDFDINVVSKLVNPKYQERFIKYKMN